MRILIFLVLTSSSFSATSQVELTDKVLISTEFTSEFQYDETIEIKYDTAARTPIEYPDDGVIEIVDFPDVKVRLSDWERSLDAEIRNKFNASTKKLFKPFRRKKNVVIQFEFEINKEDKLQNLTRLNGDYPEVSEEIARILNTLKWRSGESGGRSVNSRCTLSVIFIRRFHRRKK